MKDNPNFPELWPFVIYDPDTQTYMTSRIKLHRPSPGTSPGAGYAGATQALHPASRPEADLNSGGYCTYWAKDHRKAKFYRTKKHAMAMMYALRQEGREHVTVMEDRNV